VHGRNAISWEEKFKLDVWYVDNWSLWLDVKIIGMTMWKILKREGISQPGCATAEEFNPQITPVPSPGATPEEWLEDSTGKRGRRRLRRKEKMRGQRTEIRDRS
jgi:hypothetical protein